MKIEFHANVRLPRAEQIATAIENSIRERTLLPGSKLPSIRSLAAESGTSMFPVVEAYDRLVSRGLITSRHGAGYFVADYSVSSGDYLASVSAPAESEECEHSIQHFNFPGENLKLGSGFIPESWRDIEGLSLSIRHVVRQAGKNLFDYGTPQGYPKLRALLLQHAAKFGVHADISEILLTAGISHGLDLIVRRFVNTGDVVLVDDPGYFNTFHLLRSYGAMVVGVPRLANGPDLESLENLLRRHKPRLYIINSVLHNPTGSTIEPRGCTRLLFLAEKYDLTLVEDDVHADFEFEPSERLAKLGSRERVLYVGSLSKSLSSSLRVGYVIATRQIIRDLTSIKSRVFWKTSG